MKTSDSSMRIFASTVAPRCSSELLCFFVLCTPDLHAQVGNNNPSGASGIFNGQVNTGCCL